MYPHTLRCYKHILCFCLSNQFSYKNATGKSICLPAEIKYINIYLLFTEELFMAYNVRRKSWRELFKKKTSWKNKLSIQLQNVYLLYCQMRKVRNAQEKSKQDPEVAGSSVCSTADEERHLVVWCCSLQNQLITTWFGSTLLYNKINFYHNSF